MCLYLEVIISVMARVECHRKGHFGNFSQKCAKILSHAGTCVPNRVPNRLKFGNIRNK